VAGGGGDAPAGGGETAADLERYVGEYDASSLFGRPVTVLVRDGALAMDVPGQIVYTLGPPDEEGLRPFVGFPEIRVRFVEADPPGGSDAADGDEDADADGQGPTERPRPDRRRSARWSCIRAGSSSSG